MAMSKAASGLSDTDSMKADARILAGWHEQVGASSFPWRDDKRYREHNDGVLYYIGGESGQYIKLTNDGRLMAGDYDHARPGTEDAVLSSRFMKKLGSYEEALAMAFRLGGDRLAADLFGDAERLMALVDKNRKAEYTSVLKTIQEDKAAPKPPRKSKSAEKNKDIGGDAI